MPIRAYCISKALFNGKMWTEVFAYDSPSTINILIGSLHKTDLVLTDKIFFGSLCSRCTANVLPGSGKHNDLNKCFCFGQF